MENRWRVLGERDLKELGQGSIEAALNAESDLGWELVTAFRQDEHTWFAFREQPVG
jgi:hypothetical protein